jgi:hypothetical protein
MMSSALPSGPAHEGMDGMLSVIGHMPIAALARLLQLTADSMGQTPEGVLASIELPPELAAELAAMLKPSPQSEQERGVPPEANVAGIAQEVAESDEEDLAHLQSLVRATTGRAAAARGLLTTVRMAREKPSDETVLAVADAIKAAVKEAALTELASAAELIKDLADDPALASSVRAAQQALHEHGLLEACARLLAEEPGADNARALLFESGTPGAEALLAVYLESNEIQRTNLMPVVSHMIEAVAPVAGRILRSGDATSASTVLRLLGSAGSRRLAPTIASGLEHLDIRVREAAATALADSPGPESAQLLQKALGHWDPETRRVAAREIGRGRKEELVPALLKIVGEVSLLERNYELKKEVLKSLEALHSPRAIPVLKRLANRKAVIGKKNRELRYLARRVLDSLE